MPYSKSKLYLAVTLLSGVAAGFLIVTGNSALPATGTALFLLFFALAGAARCKKSFSGLSFTFQIFAFVSFTLYFPHLFTNWGFDTKLLIVPSVQLIMFGMGTKLSLGDFISEFRKPVKIIIGTALIYVIMPLVGLVIIKVYQFPPEVAAGVILIGVCPAGAASNVMTYLAGGNLALALSITMLATFVSPLATPFLMDAFAGKLITVDAVGMMISILNMIFVPVSAGLVCNRILYSDNVWLQRKGRLPGIGLVCALAGLALLFVPFPPAVKALQSGLVLVFCAIAAVSFAKLAVARVNGPANWMEMVLPKLSLTSIMLYIVIVTAQNRETLLSIGPALFIASIVHNLLGFALGYLSARALRLSDRDVRTFTIEVGLKNAGVGVGLAYDVLRSQAAGLASLLFGTWMNVSGSTLANFWSQRKPREEHDKAGGAYIKAHA